MIREKSRLHFLVSERYGPVTMFDSMFHGDYVTFGRMHYLIKIFRIMLMFILDPNVIMNAFSRFLLSIKYLLETDIGPPT